MKLIEQLRTLWYSFWMWSQVGPATKSVEYNPLIELKPYWIPMVANNSHAIAKALGIAVDPKTEDEAHTLYSAWCAKTDVDEEQYAQASIAASNSNKKPQEANWTITPNAELSKLMTRSWAHPAVNWDWDSFKTVQARPQVWIYNASRMEHSVDHPVLGTVRIPANTTSKRYSLYTSLPHTVAVPKCDIDANITYGSPLSGARLAMDLINPDNLGLGQNEALKFSTGVGRNLGEKGVFWSLNNPPHRGEVTEAVKRMEKRYKMLLEKVAVSLTEGANSFEDLVKAVERDLKKSGTELAPKEIRKQARTHVRAFFNITPEHHAAADHFRVTTEWHPVLGGTR